MTVPTGIYVRISSDVTGEGLGVARQEADCRTIADRLGWAVTEVYCDNDASAFSGKKRPAYDRLLADIQSGKVRAVLAYAPDRLYRRLADLSRFIDIVRDAGAQVQTVAAGEIDLNTAAGRQTAGLLGVIAAGESDRTGERIRRKLAENAREGKPHGGPNRPYGWEPDKMTIRETEAAVILECVGRVIAGEPMRSIVRDLNARSIPNAIGKAWSHAGLGTVLRGPRNAGLRVHQGKVIGQAAWPAIVPTETWGAMMRVLSDPARVTTPGRGGKLHLLSVIVRCGICNGPMIVTKGRKYKGVRKSIYRCRDAHVQRTQDHMDNYITAVILTRLSRPDAVMLLHAPDDAPARQAAMQEAERVRHRMAEAAESFADGLIDGAQLQVINSKLRPRLAELEAAAAPPPDRALALAGLVGAEDIEAKWAELSVEQRRLVISTLLDIEVFPGGRGNFFRTEGIEITWKS